MESSNDILSENLEVTTPEPTQTTTVVQPDWTPLLESQNRVNQQLSSMAELLQRQQQQLPPTQTAPPAVQLESLPIEWEGEGDDIKGKVPVTQILKTTEQLVDERIAKMTQPYALVLDKMMQEDALARAVQTVRRERPELLNGRNERDVAFDVLTQFHSPFLQHLDPASRTVQVYDRLASRYGTGQQAGQAQTTTLPLSTGSGSTGYRPANQVGSTGPAGAPMDNPYGNYPPGSTIKVKIGSINSEGGLGSYQDKIARISAMEDWGRQNNMNWKFEHVDS